MDFNKNYYGVLEITPDSDERSVKKKYYELSKQHHPDKGGSQEIFSEIVEAYDVLTSELRKEYDLKSKFGNSYNEYYELFSVNVDYDYDKQKSQFETFKKNEVNNIKLEVDDDFVGSLEYERWAKCKPCDGTGKDFSSKIVIRDLEGNIVKTFDGDDGCDYCEGSGKDYNGSSCYFCLGKGKIGLNECNSCSGDGRIMGKQKLKGIKLTGNDTRIESMGHWSKNGIGYLLLSKK
jgi:curved DNA-binding protein CbpA